MGIPGWSIGHSSVEYSYREATVRGPMQMGLMSEAQRAGRWSQEVTRDGDSDDSAMQWALSSLSHGGLYRPQTETADALRHAP